MRLDSIPADARYDVVVIGGALSGGSLALLLRRWSPGARILVVERRETFDRKVGEATVELSGMFLQRVLRLYDHLAREHLPKHGLRYWFAGGEDDRLEEMSEIGARGISALPSFMLDRSKLDEKILDDAVEDGVDLLRPARVRDANLGWPESTVVVERDGERRTIACRWLIDASGRDNLLARKLDLHEPLDAHPTGAVWARFRGVRDLDGPALAGGDPRAPRLPLVGAARRLATNHFCGYGWWCWVIPLAGGETSIGLVYDKRLFAWPTEGKLRDRFERFLRSRPGLRELLDGATIDGDDFNAYAQLPFRSRKYADRGWALVGDAAAFIDPYYSPGLDHAAFSVYATARLVQDDLAGALDRDALERRLADHNARFARSFDNWFEGLYRDKYEILGDAELTVASFYFDTGNYYLGVVGPAYRDIDELGHPVLGLDVLPARIAARVMRLFRRRIVRIARFRRATGTYGRRNNGWKLYRKRFETGARALGLVGAGLRLWLRAEAHMLLWRLRHGRVPVEAPRAAGGRRGVEARS